MTVGNILNGRLQATREFIQWQHINFRQHIKWKTAGNLLTFIVSATYQLQATNLIGDGRQTGNISTSVNIWNGRQQANSEHF